MAMTQDHPLAGGQRNGQLFGIVLQGLSTATIEQQGQIRPLQPKRQAMFRSQRRLSQVIAQHSQGKLNGH